MDTVLEIAALLEPLSTADGRFFIRVQVGEDPARSPAELLHPILFAPDFDRGEYDLPGIPKTVQGLATALCELPVTAAQMVPFLVQTCTTDLAHMGASRGPWSIEAAQAVLDRVVQTLGPQTRWWTNVSYSTWCWEHGDFSDGFSSNPVTGHEFDRAVIGIGADATVTLLAFADP
ncbi:hypothetical protein [Actinomadura terrae]|uniref:hypothetical protein n=1 Tax=Actinomadura terrae TaxID=604353 RepID=UPI001FA80F45|nr:hypothetical protein [Actinomadura terrae]